MTKPHATPTSATRVQFNVDTMWVHLTDGRVLGIPSTGFPAC